MRPTTTNSTSVASLSSLTGFLGRPQRWQQAKLATDDDLYAFLRAEGMVEYHSRLRAESVDLATLKELEVQISIMCLARIFEVAVVTF